MRDADNIRDISALGVDMIGLIFYPQSPRYVQMLSSGAGIIPTMHPIWERHHSGWVSSSMICLRT